MQIQVESNFDIDTARYKQFNEKELENYEKITIEQIFQKAGVPKRTTGGYYHTIYLNKDSNKNWKSQSIYEVGTKDLKTDNFYLRVLEVLAYGFFNYHAKEAVSFKGYFYVKPKAKV